MTPTQATSSRDKQSKAGIVAAVLCGVTLLPMASGWLGGAFETRSGVPTPYLKQALIASAASMYSGLLALGFGVCGIFQRQRKRSVAAWSLAISLVALGTFSLLWLNHLEAESKSDRHTSPKLRPRPLQ